MNFRMSKKLRLLLVMMTVCTLIGIHHFKSSSSYYESMFLRVSPKNSHIKELATYHAISYQKFTKKFSPGEDTHNLSKIKALIQDEIFMKQYPKDCTKKKKLICNIGTRCGLGCQIGMLTRCLHYTYSNDMVLVLNDTNWQYYPKGWTELFKPLASTECTIEGAVAKLWPGDNTTEVFLSNWDPGNIPSVFHPVNLPSKYTKSVHNLVKHTTYWWIAQLASFILRFNDQMELEKMKTWENVHHMRPIVGIHVRRSDKVTEVPNRKIEEYFKAAEKIFEKLKVTNNKTVYLATDDPKIIRKLTKKYVDYKFIYDMESSKLGASHTTRYSPGAIKLLLKDTVTLVSCDYLITTLSSSFGRLLYLLRLSTSTTLGSQIVSLGQKDF